MNEIYLAVVDERKKRAAYHQGIRDCLLVASKNPRTVEGFNRTHVKLIGWPAFSNQKFDKDEILDLRIKDAKQITDIARKFEFIGNQPIRNLLKFADFWRPPYVDFAPDEENWTKDNYRGLPKMVVDLRTKLVLVDGSPNKFATKDMPPHMKIEGEDYYEEFGYISQLRDGVKSLDYMTGKPAEPYRYHLGKDWKIKDVRTGRVF